MLRRKIGDIFDLYPGFRIGVATPTFSFVLFLRGGEGTKIVDKVTVEYSSSTDLRPSLVRTPDRMKILVGVARSIGSESTACRSEPIGIDWTNIGKDSIFLLRSL